VTRFQQDGVFYDVHPAVLSLPGVASEIERLHRRP
jgi:hypothetical protein